MLLTLRLKTAQDYVKEAEDVPQHCSTDRRKKPRPDMEFPEDISNV